MPRPARAGPRNSESRTRTPRQCVRSTSAFAKSQSILNRRGSSGPMSGQTGGSQQIGPALSPSRQPCEKVTMLGEQAVRQAGGLVRLRRRPPVRRAGRVVAPAPDARARALTRRVPCFLPASAANRRAPRPSGFLADSIGLRRSRRQYDLSGPRKHTEAAPFPPRLASKSPLAGRPPGSAYRTWYRAKCSP
jgi:hypothetical protein